MANKFLSDAAVWSQGHQISEKVLRFCEDLKKKYPSAHWALNYSEQESFSLNILDQKIEQCELSQIEQLDIEIFLDQKSASASVLGPVYDNWLETAERAFAMAQRAEQDQWLSFPEAHFFDTNLKSSNHLARPIDISADAIKTFLMELESAALNSASAPFLRSDGAHAQASYQRHTYCNSAGLKIITPSTYFGNSLSLIAQKGEHQESDYMSDGACSWAELRSYHLIANEAVQRTVSKLDKRKIPSGNYPVIFSYRASLGLIGCLLKALSGRLQYMKSSYLLGACGQLILPSWVSLSDNPRALNRSQFAVIDRDGLPTYAHTLIKEGRLEEYILSHYSAKRMGLNPNALASGLMNMELSTNAQDLQQLVDLYPECVVVHGTSGTGINLMHGDYSQGIEGFYYKNGVCQHAIEEATVAANLKELFLSLEAHASDWQRPEGAHIGSLAFPSMAVSCS